MLLGIVLAGVLLECGLRAGGGLFLAIQERRNRFAIQRRATYRVLCLGESTTAGEYPRFLGELLNSQPELGVTFSVIDKGIPATSTTRIVQQLERYLDQYQPDIVVTMMGINDQPRIGAAAESLPARMFRGLESLKTYRVMGWLRECLAARGGGTASAMNDPTVQTSVTGVDHPSPNAFVAAGWHALSNGRFTEAQHAFKAALALDPRNDGAFIWLGRTASWSGRLAEAEELFQIALALNPRSDRAFCEWGWLAIRRGRPTEARQRFEAALALNPRSDVAFAGLGEAAFSEGRWTEAQALHQTALTLNGGNIRAHLGLATTYLFEGHLAVAERVLTEVPAHGKAYRLLVQVYEAMGNRRLARAYRAKIRAMGFDTYPAQTRRNHRQLKRALDRRGIAYVCVQYPMRSIEPLKALLAGTGETLFVENERSFREAVAREGYRAYFRDAFGGDFGHCTEKGNRLLADNIARVILKQVSGR